MKLFILFFTFFISTLTMGYLLSKIPLIKNRILNIFVFIFGTFYIGEVVSLIEIIFLQNKKSIFVDIIKIPFEVATFLLIIYLIHNVFKSLKRRDFIILIVLYIFSLGGSWLNRSNWFINNQMLIILIKNILILPLLLYLYLIIVDSSRESDKKNSVFTFLSRMILIIIFIYLTDGLLEAFLGIDIPKDPIIIISYSFLAIFYIEILCKNLGGESKFSITDSFINKYRITKREVDVISHLITGLSYKDISLKLNISETTVKTHVHNIYNKIGVSSRFQLINILN